MLRYCKHELLKLNSVIHNLPPPPPGSVYSAFCPLLKRTANYSAGKGELSGGGGEGGKHKILFFHYQTHKAFSTRAPCWQGVEIQDFMAARSQKVKQNYWPN